MSASNNFSLRQIFEVFTYGTGDTISFPVYVANYFFDILATLYPFFVIIAIVVGGYNIIKSSSSSQAMKEYGIYLLVLLFFTYLMVNLKGPNKYNGKETYTIIDLYASVLRTGEDLADSLTYNILFSENSYSAQNPPKASAELDGYFENSNSLSIFQSTNAQQIAEAKREARKNIYKGIQKLTKPPSNKYFKNIIFIKKVVLNKDVGLGWYEDIVLNKGKSTSPSKILKSLADEPFIWYGSAVLSKRKGLYINNYTKASKLFYMSYSTTDIGTYPQTLKSIPSYGKDLVLNYKGIISSIRKNVESFNSGNFYQNSGDSPFKQNVLSYIEVLKTMEKQLSALAKVVYKPSPTNINNFENAINTTFQPKSGGINYMTLYQPFNEVMRKLSKDMQDVYSKLKVYDMGIGVDINVLNNIADEYKDIYSKFITNMDTAFAEVARGSKDNRLLFYSLAPSNVMLSAVNSIQDKSLYKIGPIADNKLNTAKKNFLGPLTYLDEYNKAADKTGKDLKSLADLTKNIDDKNRRISWVDLGFYYAYLKSYYAEYILYDTYLVLNGAYDEYIVTNADELRDKINIATQARNYAKEYNDFEKQDKLITTAVSLYTALGAAKGISRAVKNSSESSSIMGKLYSIFTGAVTTVASAGVHFAKAYVVVSIITNVIFILLPSILWMLAVLAWFFKTTIMISLVPINIFMIFFRNKTQAVMSMMFNLLGQALVPATMVVIYFLTMIFSTELEYVLDKFIPLLSPELAGNYTGQVTSLVDSWFDKIGGESSIREYIAFIMKTAIMILINTQLYLQFFRADDYVSEIIGERVSYGQTVSGEAIMNKLKIGHHV